MSLFSLVWLCCSNDVSRAQNFWTTRINQKLWLNDHSWTIGCNKIFVSPFVFTVQTRKIGSVYSQENYRNCCHQMSDFKAKKAPNSISAGAPPQTLLGELAALSRAPSWIHLRSRPSGPWNNLPPQLCIPKSAYGPRTRPKPRPRNSCETEAKKTRGRDQTLKYELKLRAVRVALNAKKQI